MWIEHLLRMRKIKIPINYMFIGHGYLLHVGAERTGYRPLHYHLYFISQGHHMMDAVAFTYGWGFKKEDDVTSSDSEGNDGSPDGAGGVDGRQLGKGVYFFR